MFSITKCSLKKIPGNNITIINNNFLLGEILYLSSIMPSENNEKQVPKKIKKSILL